MQTGQVVALKKLRMERERDGMPVTSVREVRVLQACTHANLVNLIKVVTGPSLDRRGPPLPATTRCAIATSLYHHTKMQHLVLAGKHCGCGCNPAACAPLGRPAC